MPMRRGPSPHLTWAELACHDRIRTPYPLDWRDGPDARVRLLADAYEALRAACGNRPFRVLSAFRTPEHNRRVGGAAKSQHVQGRALDLQHEHLTPRQVADLARQLAATTCPQIGGLGLYPTFVHLDVRPRTVAGSIAYWEG